MVPIQHVNDVWIGLTRRLWVSDIKNEARLVHWQSKDRGAENAGRTMTMLWTELESKRLIEMVSALGCS
jgi:hypothetical protein